MTNVNSETIDTAIGKIRLYLDHGFTDAFADGRTSFIPNEDWAPMITLLRQIRANDHVLTNEQRENIEKAIQTLEKNSNKVVELLRRSIEERSAGVACEAKYRELLNVAVEQVRNDFGEAARRHFEMRELPLPPVQNYGNMHMGDVFSNISNSSVVSRSKVENAFNRLNESGNEEAAKLIMDVADCVSQSANPAAGAVYAQLADEAVKPKPDKSVIKSCWDGLVAILPSISTMSPHIMKAFGLI